MFKKIINYVLITCFLATFIIPVPQAKANTLGLPEPGIMVSLSPAYMPVMIKGLKVHPENPLLFDFILDTGKSGLEVNSPAFKAESEKLIKYFLASLTIKEDDLWVNLSPYERDRIIPDQLGETELGRDMLAQDYILKQLTASLIYPEKQLGKDFWNRIYAKSQQMFGTSEIPINTFNKVWILADKAKVLERNDVAYVVGSHLKVMLEEDYMALTKQSASHVKKENNEHTIASQIVREIIIPELEKEVNQGQNFSPLRQMFHSMILATWFKLALKDALLNQVYSNKEKTGGVLSDDPAVKEKIYEQYLKAYKKGAFNYIKEEMDTVSKQPISRKYFSGGLARDLGIPKILDRAQTVTPEELSSMSSGDLAMATVKMAKQVQGVERPDAAMLNDAINQLKTQLPFTFSVDSIDVVKPQNWPTIDQITQPESAISNETKQLVLLAIVKNKAFNPAVQGETGILEAIAYFRQLHPDKKTQIAKELKLLGQASTAEWLERNSNNLLHELYGSIEQQFGIKVSTKTVQFLGVHDQAVRRARGLRLTLETVSSLKNAVSGQTTSQLITSNKMLRDVVFGLRKAGEVKIENGDFKLVSEMLWGLKQMEGININLVRLGENQYYAYEEYALKRIAQQNNLALGVTTQGLEHLIKLDMARRRGVFFELSNHAEEEYDSDITHISQSILNSESSQPLVTWDAKEAFWRATPIAGRILEMERTPIQTVYIATMNREVALRTQLEAEAESNRIFNRQSKLVIIDDSSPEILKANKRTLEDLYQRYGWEYWHITPEEREKEYDAYDLPPKKWTQRRDGFSIKTSSKSGGVQWMGKTVKRSDLTGILRSPQSRWSQRVVTRRLKLPVALESIRTRFTTGRRSLAIMGTKPFPARGI